MDVLACCRLNNIPNLLDRIIYFISANTSVNKLVQARKAIFMVVAKPEVNSSISVRWKSRHFFPDEDISSNDAGRRLLCFSNSRSSFFTFVSRDRHLGDVCHVFECADQSARSLASALHDVMMMSHKAPVTVGKKSERRQSKNDEIIANGGKMMEKFVDDHNNNNVVVGMYECSVFTQKLVD